MYDLTKIEKTLGLLDVTGLVNYSRKVSEIANITRLSAPEYIREFIMAYDMTATMLSDLTRTFLEAKSALDHAESIAYLENASEYLQKNEIKDTADARKRYVDIDPAVVECKDVVGRITALDQLLKNKLTLFKSAHDDVKKIYYADQERSVFEGM